MTRTPLKSLSRVLFSLLILGFAGLGLGVAASAQAVSRGAPPCGQPEGIDDDSYDGTLDPIACCDFQVSNASPIRLDVKVNVAVSHTQVGDLTIKLESPAGTLVTLMSRPGLLEAADDGTECCGFESDWDGSLVRFADAAQVSAEAMGVAGLAVCSEDDVCDYASAPGSAEGLGLADFEGEDPNGTWLCCVGDGAPGDVGTLDDCALDLSIFIDGFETGDTDNWSATS